MGITINELVTKFTFDVNKSGLNDYESGIKKARNTEKQASKDRISQAEQERNKLLKDIEAVKTAKTKWLNDHNKLELKYIKEQESLKNKINALNVKDWNFRQKLKEQEHNKAIKDTKTLTEFELKGYENKRKAVEWLADLKAKKANQELQEQRRIRDEQERLNTANRKNLAEYNSKNRMARLDAIVEERRLQRQNHKEKLDQIRRERTDRLQNITELAGLGYGAKNTFDKLIASPTKVASDMEKANIFLQTFGDTDAQGQKYIQKKIKEGAKLGAAMPLDIEQMVIELGKGGYKGKGSGDKNELANMIPFIMQLSRATGGSPTEAGELITNTAASFGIKSKDGYSRITDMFTYALNESKLNFADLSLALKYSGGSSGAAGESLPTILANMAIARQKGINLSTLGTSSRMMTLRSSEVADNLGASIKKRGKTQGIQETYKNLGITEKDIINKGGGLDKDKLFFYLRKKFKMDDKHIEEISLGTYKGPQLPSQLALMKTMKSLFGVTAVSGAMALLKENEYDKNMRKNMQSEKYLGESGRVNQKLNSGMDYQMMQAEIEWYYAKQNFGKQFLPIATKLAKAITDMSEAFANMTPKQVGFVNYAGILTTALLGLASGAKAFNMVAPLLGKSWAIGFGPVGLVAVGIADLISYLTGGPSMTGGLIWAIQSLEKWLTGGKFGQALGQFASDFVNAGDRVQFLIDKVKTLLGLTSGGSSGKTVDIIKNPKGVPEFGNPKARNFNSTKRNSPMSFTGGAVVKSSVSETVVHFSQYINSNSSNPGQVVKEVAHGTKKALAMINSKTARRGVN